MPTQRHSANQIKGLVFAVDAKQVKDIHVLNGKNFLIDAAGPHSAFGSTFITYTQLEEFVDICTFRVNEDIFLIAGNAILQYDAPSQQFYPIFVFTSSLEIAPWSHAHVGGKDYFLKKGTNLIEFDVISNSWREMDSEDGVPEGPVFCCESAGRLIVLGQNRVQYSSIDMLDTGLVTNTDLGAGFQLTSLAGHGDPLLLLPTADGFITVISTGFMKSDFIESVIPFRHYPFQKGTEVPINAFCGIEIGNNEHVILNKKGFYITNGTRFEPWQPLFGEFINRELLPSLVLTVPDVIRLSYHDDSKWFIVSYDTTGRGGKFDRAYVLYVPKNEWGSFDRAHIAFGELDLVKGHRAGFNFGYVDPDGNVRRFVTFPQFEEDFDRTMFYHQFMPVEYPARKQNGITIFPTIMDISTKNHTLFKDLATGWYFVGELENRISPTGFFASDSSTQLPSELLPI